MKVAELKRAVKDFGKVTINHHIIGNLGPITKVESCGLPNHITLTIEDPYRWLTTINPCVWTIKK